MIAPGEPFVSLTQLPRWVPWRLERRRGSAKQTKVPYVPGGGWSHARTDDPSTWAPYEAAAKMAGCDGTGLVLTGLAEVAALDLDNCRDPETGRIAPWAHALCERAQSYTEITPSRRGLRIVGIAAGLEPTTCALPQGEGQQVEIYAGGATRYITVSWQGVEDYPDTLNDIGPLVRELIDRARPPWPDVDDKPRAKANGAAGSADSILLLLPNDYDGRARWVEIGLAHKGAGGTFAAFDAWSQRHPKYNADTTRRMWEGLKPDGRITLGTLVHELKQHGIKPPRHTAGHNGAEEPGDKAGAADTAAEAEAETRPPEFSDDALALRFAADYADRLRYVAAWGKWMSWAGTCWRTDDTLLSFDRVRLICREAAATAIACEKPKLAPTLTSAKTVAGVTGLARSDRRLAAISDQWDADLDALNNQQDNVNLRTGEPYKSRPEDYMTKAAAVSPGGDCPLWRAFLDRITAEDGELQAYLQRVAGYCLTGHTSEHAVFFLYGTGANGKGSFVNTLVGIMGDYAITAPMEVFIESKVDRHPTELAMLRGARLVAASETQVGRHWNEARVKALTGGDRVPARFMRGDYFEFTPQFKLMISGNHKPSLRNVDEAMRRRLHIIPFTVTIPPAERDLDLAEKLKAEWPGILQWAIDGALEWRRIGLKPPEAVQEATRDYLEAEDDILSWITECCTQEAAARTRSADLYASWKEWAERTGRKGGAGSQKAFSQALEDKGFPKKKGRTVAMFFGLRVASQDLGL